MDAFHERLARIALARIAAYGFCLAGGYAVQAHGILERPSEDVDLFTTSDAEARFPAAVAEVIQAYVDDGLVVSTLVDSPGFARLGVSDPSVDVTSKVELGIDWRAHAPTVLAIGPVLHPDDAVADTVGALYSRAQTRDYIDVPSSPQAGTPTRPGTVEGRVARPGERRCRPAPTGQSGGSAAPGLAAPRARRRRAGPTPGRPAR